MVSSPRQQEKWPFPGTRGLRGREGRAPGEASSHPRDSLKTPRVCRARFPGHPIAQLLCLHLSKRHPSPPADTVLTPRPASTAVLGRTWNPMWQLRGRLGKDTDSIEPRPKAPVAPTWHAGDAARTARAALRCAPREHWPFSPSGAQSLSPPRASALVLCLPGTLTPDLHGAPGSTGLRSNVSRTFLAPAARVPAPPPPVTPQLGLMACLPSFLCPNHCPPDRVPLFMVCTSRPPARLAGPPGRALSPVLCHVGHVAGAP